MTQDNFFNLFYTYLEERTYNNVRAHSKEEEVYQEYENLHLSEEQCKTIAEWVDGTHTTSSAYSMILFRMGMQLCFSLMTELADWK